VVDNGGGRFIDAIRADLLPKSFPAPPTGNVLRGALALRAGDARLVEPDGRFVNDLHHRVASTADVASLPWEHRDVV
jgi:hypothetical protein